MKKLIYGNIILYEFICKNCREKNLVGDINDCCSSCGTPLSEVKITEKKVIVSTKRRSLTPKQKKELIEKQDNRCFWCGRDFGTMIVKKDKVQKLKIVFDHLIPFSYLQANPKENFVASCRTCNSFKSSFVFDDINACKEYLKKRWDKSLKSGKIEIIF